MSVNNFYMYNKCMLLYNIKSFRVNQNAMCECEVVQYIPHEMLSLNVLILPQMFNNHVLYKIIYL